MDKKKVVLSQTEWVKSLSLEGRGLGEGEKKLIIELDGGQHALPDEILKDRQRDAWLEKEGYTVVRFWDNEVLTNTSGVLEAIGERLPMTPSPQSPPLKGGDVITHTK